MNFFIYDETNNVLRIDDSSIFLVKEFKALLDPVRNKCKEDKTGTKALRAFKELTYIYLMLDFKSPYFRYMEQDKHEAALADSELTEDQLKDPLFVTAYQKYNDIQEADPILILIKTTFRTLYKMRVFLDNIDFNEDVDETGRPLYKPKDVIADLKSISEARKQVQLLEAEYKSSLSAASSVRGGVELGFDEA
jgi:hypothetical protein